MQPASFQACRHHHRHINSAALGVNPSRSPTGCPPVDIPRALTVGVEAGQQPLVQGSGAVTRVTEQHRVQRREPSRVKKKMERSLRFWFGSGQNEMRVRSDSLTHHQAASPNRFSGTSRTVHASTRCTCTDRFVGICRHYHK